MTSKMTLTIAVLTLTLASTGAVGQPHAHGHPAAALATEQLKLNDGKKWATDAVLREEMSAIRADVEAAIAPVHQNRYTPADFQKLGASIETRVNRVIAKCKLPPEVDAQFHLVVADLFAAASAMKTEGDRTAGVVKSIRALNAYGEFFDQPGWAKIAH
jgi:hypothetical protein